jgi:hypothetical protein
MGEIATAGALLAQSGMFGAMNQAAGFVIAATCHQQGISLMEFTRTYHIVEGKPSMRADAMLAEFRKAGGKHRILSNTTERAAVELEIDGQKVEFAYDINDAKRTGDCFKGDGKTLKHNWSKRPEDMLWARVISRGVRRLRPEIVAGLYTPEEVEDFAPERAAPAPITVDEAARRAKPVDATVTAAFAPQPTIDASTCPVLGTEFDGQSWGDIPTEALANALAYEGPELTHAHKAAIRLVIEDREAVAS